MSERIASVDVESTGLDPTRHVAWEIAIVIRDGDTTTEHQWFIKPSLATADPFALRVGRYYERTANLLAPGSRKQGAEWANPDVAAAEIARLLDGATLLGHNPAFDAAMVGAFLRRHGHVLTADHHQIDTGTLVTGFIAGQRRAALRRAGLGDAGILATRYPWPKGKHLADLATALGIVPILTNLHTALGDAKLAMAVYDAVMGGQS